jgi:hypothetical protein
MFHFPAFPPTPYEFGMQVTRHDSRQVTPFGHPGITARLTAPPGLSQPPTSFIGPWYQGIHRPPLPTYPTHKTHITTNHRTPKNKNARVHYANLNPPPTHHHTTHTQQAAQSCLAPRQQPRHHTGNGQQPTQGHPRLFPQNLNRVSTALPARTATLFPHHPQGFTPGTAVLDAAGTNRQNSPVSPPTSNPGPTAGPRGSWTATSPSRPQTLLRKEVIQPHLPVRLPCYDFVPIASPTFDGSPPCGLGHRLRVLPTFVT